MLDWLVNCNNHLESWHFFFKIVWLERKRPKKIERLLLRLLEVEADTVRKAERRQMRVGSKAAAMTVVAFDDSGAHANLPADSQREEQSSLF